MIESVKKNRRGREPTGYSWPCWAAETHRSVPFPMMTWSWRPEIQQPSAIGELPGETEVLAGWGRIARWVIVDEDQFAKDEDVIQTLAPDGADKPLREGVLPWAVTTN